MKQAAIFTNVPVTRSRPAFPNAATRRQMFVHLLDLALVGAIGMAFGAVVLFLPVLA